MDRRIHLVDGAIAAEEEAQAATSRASPA